jgi:RNA polymerase sigma factor (sigma-70 family)
VIRGTHWGAGVTPPFVRALANTPPDSLYNGMGVGRLASADRAFERLYKRHVEDVYRYSLAVLANDADAEDVVQTTFLNAYRSYQSGTRPKEAGNWLIAIAHNVCRQRFRTAARRPHEVALDPDLTAVSDDDGERYRREDIQRALSALTFPQRSALAMRELEGRSYKEIAAALEVSESAVETLIFRARRAFREQLEGTITCSEAERALSRRLDGELPRGERGVLRAHLRECEECSTLARRFRAQRSVFKGLVVLPLPSSLASFSGGGAAGGAALGGALGIKAVALGSALIVAAGATTTEITTHSRTQPAKAATSAAVSEHAAAVVPTRQATPSRARTVPTQVATHPLPAARRNRLSGHGAVSSPARVVHPPALVPATETPAAARSDKAAAAPVAAVKTSSGHETSSKSAEASARSDQSPAHGKPTAPGRKADPGKQKPSGAADTTAGNGSGKPADPGKSNADHGNGDDQPADTGNGNGSGQPADQGKPADPDVPGAPDMELDTAAGQVDPPPNGKKP